MTRDLSRLTQTLYDVLVVGGGVYGLFIAWDAALRGLSVGLVEKGDFGHATSANSLRVIHGGLRYLQHAHILRMRRSIRERTTFLRIAPHLVRPLPFLFPTYGHGLQGKEIFSLALRMNDLIGFDRNHTLDESQHLPSSMMISKQECMQYVPGIESNGLTGGAICYDAQMINSERLVISLAQSAAAAGADLANHVEVKGFLGSPHHIQGVIAEDVLNHERMEIQAKLVINASGPWVNRILDEIQGRTPSSITKFSRAFNVLVQSSIVSSYALGVSAKQTYRDHKAIINKGTRLYIVIPRQHGSLIGTAHLPLKNSEPDWGISEKEIHEFVEEFNQALPSAKIQASDIAWTYWGLLPSPSSDGEDVQLSKDFRIIDHEREEGLSGLLSVVGVKFTESRYVAEKTVDLSFRKLGKIPPRALTAVTPLCGGDVGNIQEFISQTIRDYSDEMHEEDLRSFIISYGTRFSTVLSQEKMDRTARSSTCQTFDRLLSRINYSISEESAHKLSDLIFRRLTFDMTCPPSKDVLEYCAGIMGNMLAWSEETKQRELEEVRRHFVAKSA